MWRVPHTRVFGGIYVRKRVGDTVRVARNVLDFLKLIIDKDGGLNINREDDIVAACLLSQAGQVVRAPAATSAAK